MRFLQPPVVLDVVLSRLLAVSVMARSRLPPRLGAWFGRPLTRLAAWPGVPPNMPEGLSGVLSLLEANPDERRPG